MLNKNQKSEEQIEFFIPLTKEGDKEPDRRQKKDLQKLQGTLKILIFLGVRVSFIKMAIFPA